MDGNVVARLIVLLLNLKGPELFALDGTNWKPGKTDINILALAIVTRRLEACDSCSADSQTFMSIES